MRWSAASLPDPFHPRRPTFEPTWVCRRCGVSMSQSEAIRYGHVKMIRKRNKAQLARALEHGFHVQGTAKAGYRPPPVGGRVQARRLGV